MQQFFEERPKTIVNTDRLPTHDHLRRTRRGVPLAQLLKEHLQGEGQWLTRYGDAPEPTPGAGAGVIGGGRDGDVGFMGVEAMTR